MWLYQTHTTIGFCGSLTTNDANLREVAIVLDPCPPSIPHNVRTVPNCPRNRRLVSSIAPSFDILASSAAGFKHHPRTLRPPTERVVPEAPAIHLAVGLTGVRDDHGLPVPY